MNSGFKHCESNKTHLGGQEFVIAHRCQVTMIGTLGSLTRLHRHRGTCLAHLLAFPLCPDHPISRHAPSFLVRGSRNLHKLTELSLNVRVAGVLPCCLCSGLLPFRQYPPALGRCGWTPHRWSWAAWQHQSGCVSREGEPFKGTILDSCLLNSKPASCGVKDLCSRCRTL